MDFIHFVDNPKVVIVDWHPGGPDGWDVLPKIKSRAPPHYKWPVMLCSYSDSTAA